jgi:hypothetical protein
LALSTCLWSIWHMTKWQNHNVFASVLYVITYYYVKPMVEKELMKSIGSHSSSSLLFVTGMMVWHIVKYSLVRLWLNLLLLTFNYYCRFFVVDMNLCLLFRGLGKSNFLLNELSESWWHKLFWKIIQK